MSLPVSKRAGPRSARRWLKRPNLLTSLMLVFPLFLAYQIGVLVVPGVHNGADLITGELLRLLHGQVGSYILVNLALGIAFIVLMLVLRRKHAFDPHLFVPVLLESSLYALTMGSLIVLVMQDVLHVDPSLHVAAAAAVAGINPLAKVVLALGAGVHEELVFRLILVGGLVALGQLLGFRRWVTVLFAFVVSSLLFAAAHHVIGGEPFRVGAFVYRFLCGMVFATLFETRGFAVAVYTHALYDIYVLLVRG